MQIAHISGDESSFNNSLTKGLCRGSLLYPSSDIVYKALVSHMVIQKLNEILRAHSQHNLGVRSILAALND